MVECKYKVGERRQIMFPQKGDCFFYNGSFVYVTEVGNDAAELSNGDVLIIGHFVRMIEEKEEN